MSRYQFFVSMDVQSDKEALFNEVYDSEHVPELLKVPGVLRVERSKLIDGAVLIGGVKKALANEGIARYLAVYTLSSPEVIHSEAWAVAVERGVGLKRSDLLRRIGNIYCAKSLPRLLRLFSQGLSHDVISNHR